VAVHAERHVHVDGALGGGLRGLVAMTGRALDLGANVRLVIEADVRFRRKSSPFSAIAVIFWISGRSVAICEWQIMQVLTLGRPARGPLSTPR